MEKNKYHAQKTMRVVDGEYVYFASKHEAERWDELRWLERAGKIAGMRRQVPFELVPGQMTKSGKILQPVKYIADFVYWRDGDMIVEDAKGVMTQEYKIKKKLMLWRHGIEIQEV